MAKKYRLKDEHDFSKRVSELMAKADELGVSIDFSHCNARTFITDTKTGKEYFFEDVESDISIKSFPSFTEYRIAYHQ